MTVDEALAWQTLRKSRTMAEILALSAELLADHDKIIRYDVLRDSIATMPKPDRQRVYALLDAETKKYPPKPVHEDPLFGKPFLALRSKMGLFRNVKWDRFGALRLIPEQRENDIARLQGKLEEILGPNPDLSKSYGQKVDNILQTMKEHRDILDGTVRTYGSIWDFIISDAPDATKLPPLEEV